MSDIIKYEYIKILDEIEAITATFDELQAETIQLKEYYRADPNNQELLDYIKVHEEKYKAVYEKFLELNTRAKELKAQSDAENNE